MQIKFVTLFIGNWLLILKCWSCSCDIGLLTDEIERTPEIFTGKAVSVEFFKKNISGYDQKFMRTTFGIIQNFKGVEIDQKVIISDRDGAACGFEFHKDSSYLIFAANDYYGELSSELTTGLCTRTGNLNRRKKTINKLEKLGGNIGRLNELSPDELYSNIWADERFLWTDQQEKLLLSSEGQLKILQEISSTCQIDKPSRIHFSFDISSEGKISNVQAIGRNELTKKCYSEIVGLIEKLSPWKPAQISGINVNSVGFYNLGVLDGNHANKR